METQINFPLTLSEQVSEASLVQATAHRAHFSQVIPALQIAWDSTSLGALKSCPRYYYYSHILSLRHKREATPLIFGIHYHAGLETYDRLRSHGLDHEACLIEVFKFLGHSMGKREPDAEDGTPGAWKPWDSDDTKRNWFTCMRSVIWYLDQFEDDALSTVQLLDGRPAVELSFRMEIPQIITPDKHPLLVCGHMDRVASFHDALYIVDRKTTTGALDQNYYRRYSPDNQMSLYTAAGKIVMRLPVKGVIIDAAQVQVNSTRFHRGFVNRTQHQIDEWFFDLSFYVQQAEEYAKRQYWPQNDKSCSMYGGCTFRDICARDPAVRPSFIQADFEVKEWNPLTPRGEH